MPAFDEQDYTKSFQWGIWKRLMPVMRPYRRDFAGMFAFNLITAAKETGKTRLLDTAARMFLVVAEIGVNFLAYLTNIRMEQAKKLLLSTPLSIAEVSERSGYGNYRVFTKAFKKSEGVTPSQYRRNFLEE